MSSLVLIGSGVGLLLGLVHASGVYGQRVRDAGPRLRIAPGRVRLQAAYGALWAVALWTLFGTYVLVLWLISVPLWIGARVLRTRPPLALEARP